MAKTLNELANELKEYLLNSQADAHNKASLRPERYNNLKLSMDLGGNARPHVIVSLTFSSAEYDLKTGDRLNGGLGPDEKYVLRWFGKPGVLQDLMDCWRQAERNRGRATDK